LRLKTPQFFHARRLTSSFLGTNRHPEKRLEHSLQPSSNLVKVDPLFSLQKCHSLPEIAARCAAPLLYRLLACSWRKVVASTLSSTSCLPCWATFPA
ncbi:hypothetical protein M513_09751, partial [Trichuris suis]